MAQRPDLDTELIIADYLAGESAASLARKHSANIWSILNRLRKAGIRIRSNKEQNEKRLNLSNEQSNEFIGLVDGLLLGDAWIDRKGCLRLEQSKRRLGWLDDVSNRLSEIGAQSRIIPIPPRERFLEGRTIKSKGGGLLYTPAYVELQKQRKRWYPKGEKIVPKDANLSPLSLAYWFCGDGSYDKAGALVFYTNSFRKKNVQRLAKRLTKQGAEARCIPTQRAGEFNVIITKRDAAQRFKDIIEPMMPECCMYKLQYVRPTLSPKENGRRRQKLTAEQVKDLQESRERGETMASLATKFGVTVGTLYSTLRR